MHELIEWLWKNCFRNWDRITHDLFKFEYQFMYNKEKFARQLKVYQRFLASSFTTKCDPYKSKFLDSYFNIQVLIICMLFSYLNYFSSCLDTVSALLRWLPLFLTFLIFLQVSRFLFPSMLLRYETLKGTHTVYFSSSLYIINQKPMIHRTDFHCITTWVARSSG